MKPKFTKQQVKQALERASGIQAGAANLLGCTRQTITAYVQRWPDLLEIRDQAVEASIDMAETNVTRIMADQDHVGNLKASTWYLDRLGKGRGYSVRREITGADGGPQDHRVEQIGPSVPEAAPDLDAWLRQCRQVDQEQLSQN